MPTYRAHGGLTAISHDREYPVVGGVVELPDNETWYLELVACGQLTLVTDPQPAIVQTIPEPEAAPALAEPVLVERSSADFGISSFEENGPAPEAQAVEMFTAPASTARPVKRRGGRG